ncbi:MAG: MgtC/SapB family protein [Candidatus Buchananbacteria bacterium]|nr:MgtC/SapB family protein [Candidatus Buchananbacteria bacterium]
MNSLLIILGKLLLAIILGYCIGLERESTGKPAGSRTYALVSLGATLFTIIALEGFNQFANIDPSRIVGQIIVGIGFIGAGLIIFEKHEIEGLTTAAALWTSAAMGVAIGLGWFAVAIITAFLIFFVLFVLGKLEYELKSKNTLWGASHKKKKWWF